MDMINIKKTVDFFNSDTHTMDTELIWDHQLKCFDPFFGYRTNWNWKYSLSKEIFFLYIFFVFIQKCPHVKKKLFLHVANGIAEGSKYLILSVLL